MFKAVIVTVFFIFISSLSYSQTDEIWLEDSSDDQDTAINPVMMSPEEVLATLESIEVRKGQILIGGYISSIYRESIDSVEILITVDGILLDTLLANDGLFYKEILNTGKLIDLQFHHPDYHSVDTSFILSGKNLVGFMIAMEPKYKIFLRGRAYAGNMPINGVDVNIAHGSDNYHLVTRGCFYDSEDYWNCLYDGMFRLELTADDPTDSISISLKKEGLKNLNYSMVFKEYQGEIMEMRMRYESVLPKVPMNNINLKLGFPFLSRDKDWFVSLSYYRLVNNTKFRRIAYGLEGNMYITTVTVSHPTFSGLEYAEADSSYINGMFGPSVLFWFVKPEKRAFASYIGTTLSMDVTTADFVPQIFMGSRILLDLNKALFLELRYCEYSMDVTHYTFNPFGNAFKSSVPTDFLKMHATFGIQIVF